MAELSATRSTFDDFNPHKPSPERAPLDRQVGGGHYKDMEIQPVEFITRNKIGFLEGCVIKRVCRWRNKDGKQDLLKAIHELQLLIQLEEDRREREAGNNLYKVNSETPSDGNTFREDEQSVQQRYC